MNNMPPDLSGLVPYVIAFIAVAAVGAVVSLAIISHAAATFVLAKRRFHLRIMTTRPVSSSP
jgi:hypothetical protein